MKNFDIVKFVYISLLILVGVLFVASIYTFVVYKNVPASEVPFWAWALIRSN